MYYVHKFRRWNYFNARQTTAHRSPNPLPVLVKLHVNTTMAIYLCIFFDCLHPTMAELICCNRCCNGMAHPQSLKYLLLSSLQKAFADTFLMCELPPDWSINLVQSNSNACCLFHKNWQVNYTRLYEKPKDLE